MPDLTLRAEFTENAVAQARKTDLTGKLKVHLFIGRGRTGKTTNIRYHLANFYEAKQILSLLDVDQTNPVLAQFANDVGMPSQQDDTTVAEWLSETVYGLVQSKSNIIVDFGGGDTCLSNTMREFPNFVKDIETMGAAVIANCTVGPSINDLTPLANLWALGFRPTAIAFLFNEASADAYVDVSGDHNI